MCECPHPQSTERTLGLSLMKSPWRAPCIMRKTKVCIKIKSRAYSLKRLWKLTDVTASFHSTGEDRMNVGRLDMFAEQFPDPLITWWRIPTLFTLPPTLLHTQTCADNQHYTKLGGWWKKIVFTLTFTRFFKLRNCYRRDTLWGIKGWRNSDVAHVLEKFSLSF